MIPLRFGVNFAYWDNMKAPHWPDWYDLISMDLNDLDLSYRDDVKCRHFYEPSYHPSMMSVARHVFLGLDFIKGSYSQSMQDIFILTLLDGKTNGTYLELGSFHPVHYNNTYLLTKFGWKGISVDINESLKQLWHNVRPNDVFIAGDALSIDYTKILDNHDLPNQIDYLQIDIDQGQGDVDALQKLLTTGKRFSIITFEHEQDFKKPSEEILLDYGYELLVENIACKDFGKDYWHVFEDWWIDPLQVNSDIKAKFLTTNVSITYPFELFCKPGSVDHLMPSVIAQHDIWKEIS